MCNNRGMASEIENNKTRPIINVTRALLRGMRAHVRYQTETSPGVVEHLAPEISLTRHIDQFRSPYMDATEARERYPKLPMLIFSVPNTRKSAGVYRNQSALIDLAAPEAEPLQGRIARPPVYYDLMFQFVLAASDSLMLSELMNSMILALEDPLAELYVLSPENGTSRCYEPEYTDPPQGAEMTGSDDGLFRAYGEIMIPGVEFQFHRWETAPTVRDFIMDVRKHATGSG